MCYSGKCRWEGYMGDCAFPHSKKVREKYPYPVCDIPEDEAEAEQIEKANEDIQKILKEENEEHDKAIS